MKKISKAKAQGFTLIELIVVISIIDILAAMAIPRFITVQKDARIAKMKGLYGSIRSAAMLARVECELDLAGSRAAPTCSADSTGAWANMDGVLVEMVFKYPATSPAGIISAAQIDPVNDDLDVTGGGAGLPYRFNLNSAGSPATCMITYTEAKHLGWGKGTGAATVELDTSGC